MTKLGWKKATKLPQQAWYDAIYHPEGSDGSHRWCAAHGDGQWWLDRMGTHDHDSSHREGPYTLDDAIALATTRNALEGPNE